MYQKKEKKMQKPLIIMKWIHAHNGTYARGWNSPNKTKKKNITQNIMKTNEFNENTTWLFGGNFSNEMWIYIILDELDVNERENEWQKWNLLPLSENIYIYGINGTNESMMANG